MEGGRASVTIYILECTNSKYYVGKTRSALPHARVLDHFRGQGSEWTARYPPVRVVGMIPNCSDFDEDKHTKQYMAMYGIDNVRGGTYCQVELPEDTVWFLEREIRGAEDACLRCGRTSHYVGDCFARTDRYGNYLADAPSTSTRYADAWNDSDDEEEEGDYMDEEEEVMDREACFRCGRTGHWVRNCYARTDIHGNRL